MRSGLIAVVEMASPVLVTGLMHGVSAGVLAPGPFRNRITRGVLDEGVHKFSDEHPAPEFESGCLSTEGLEVDPDDFGSAV